MDQREGASERRRDDLMIPTLSTDSSERGRVPGSFRGCRQRLSSSLWQMETMKSSQKGQMGEKRELKA